MTDRESPREVTARIIGEVAVFCTLSLLGGGLFTLVALTNINWFYPTLFYGAVVYVAGQRYFYFGQRAEQLQDEPQREIQRMLAIESEYGRAQNEAWRQYLDQMSNLVIDRELRASLVASDERLLAQARTLTLLLELGPDHKRLPLELVYRMHLIDKDNSIIKLPRAPLHDADLREATLVNADLRDVDLRHANLEGASFRGSLLDYADLSGANLEGANLAGANLEGANLNSADLSDATGITNEQLGVAKSLEGATMPDGQTLKSAANPDGPTFEDWLKDKKAREEGG